MSNSRKKNVFLNVAIGYVAQFFIILMTFIGRKIFLHFLSVDYLGINGLYSNILTILSLPELGLDSAVVFFLYKPIAEKNEELTFRLVSYFKKIYRILAISIFLIGLCLIPVLKYIINSSLSNYDLVIYYILFLLNTCISYLAAHKVALLSACQEQRIQKITILVSNIFLQVLHIVVLVLWKNYYLYVTATIVGTIINNLILSYICNKRHPVYACKKNTSSIDKSEIVKKVGSTFIYKIGTVIINSTSNILISIIVGISAVGLYSNYYTITTAISGFLSIVTTSLISSVGNLSAIGSKKRQYGIFNTLQFIYSYIGTAISIGLYFLFNDFITLWLGEQYLLNDLCVFAISFNFYLTTAVSPIWMYREANGLFEQVKYLMLITAFFNIIFSVVLGNIFGLAGILISPAISRLVTNVWYEPRILYKRIFQESALLYLKNQLKYVFLTLVSVFISYICVTNISLSGILGFIVKGSILVILTTLIYYIPSIKTNEVKELLSIISGGKKYVQK